MAGRALSRRAQNYLIAVVCFGPIALTLLPFGLLLFPMWIVMVIDRVTGRPVGAHYGPDETIWAVSMAPTLVLLGVAGLIGLFRVLSSDGSSAPTTKGRRLTQGLVACGVLGIVIFNVGDSGINPLEHPIPATMYWILPLIGTLYFFYAARAQLFRI